MVVVNNASFYMLQLQHLMHQYAMNWCIHSSLRALQPFTLRGATCSTARNMWKTTHVRALCALHLMKGKTASESVLIPIITISLIDRQFSSDPSDSYQYLPPNIQIAVS